MDELREHADAQRVAHYVNSWPEALRGNFWSAVNAPTHRESAEKTLAFATALAHELAEKIRAKDLVWDGMSDFAAAVAGGHLAAADLIDPEVR